MAGWERKVWNGLWWNGCWWKKIDAGGEIGTGTL